MMGWVVACTLAGMIVGFACGFLLASLATIVERDALKAEILKLSNILKKKED